MSETDKNSKKGNLGKSWLSITSIIISLFALGFSVYTYFETTKPHTQFEEVCKKLEILKEEINEAEKRIEQWKSSNLTPQYLTNLKIYEEYLWQAKRLYQEARGHLISGNYTQAEQLIEESHEIVNKITYTYLPAPEMSWQIAVIVVIIVAIAVIVYATRRRT